MAWRVDEAVIRAEIDNRTRGCVTGHIWFAGRAAPVELALTGNCWRDLAGRRLEFTNPRPQPGDLAGLATVQRGGVGDITASRKVKVPDISREQIGAYYAEKKPWPWHWGNSLYLEWFGDDNGRIVIESADFALKVVGEPAWEMTAAEEEQQRRINGETLAAMTDRLARAAAAAGGAEDPPPDEEDGVADDDDDRNPDRPSA